MATSEERREVSERLRWLASKQGTYKGVLGSDVLVPLRLLSVDHPGFMTRKSVARLADLIDPTCKDVGDEAHFVCSSCGCRVDRWQGDLDLDPITPTVMEDGEGLVTPRYCPSCGARVVKTDD